MHREKRRYTVAAVYWLGSQPVSYSLFADREAAASAKPLPGKSMTLETFAEAYRLIPDLEKHFTPEGVPREE